MTKRDYYEVLGVGKDASAEDIKKAYRQQAKKCHPDVCKDKDAEEKFKELSEAYEVLADSNKKANYDQYGHKAAESTFGQSGFDWSNFTHYEDISDIFGGRDFFGRDIFDLFMGGGGRDRNGPMRGRDHRYDIEITLEEAAQGVSREIDVERTEQCAECRGSGAKAGTTKKRCNTCGGSGQMRKEKATPFGRFITVANCSTCNGEGTIIDSPCPKCSGTGRVRNSRKITVKIPGGFDTGSSLRLGGQGEAGYRGGPPGDLYIVVHVLPHNTFVRDGYYLYIEVPISFSQAAIGAEIEVPTLLKGKAKLKIPAGTQTGSTFRLKGEGMPEVGGRGKGDQNVKVRVVTPRNLGKREKELFSELGGIEVKGEGLKGFIGKVMGDMKGTFK